MNLNLKCLDVGSAHWLNATFVAVTEALSYMIGSRQANLNSIETWMSTLDPRLDKQRFLEANHALFVMPKRFEFHSHKGDEVYIKRLFIFIYLLFTNKFKR